MKKILIVKTGALGDVLRTTTILEGLKEKYPNSKIDWLTSKEAYPLIKGINIINKILFPNLSIGNYDYVICLEEEIDLLKKIPKTTKYFGTYIDNGKINYTTNSAPWNDMSLISRFGKKKADSLKRQNKTSYQELLYSMLGLDWKKQKYKLGHIPKSSEINKKIGVVVSAGKRWPMKSLPEDKLIKLVKIIYSKGYDVLLLGGKDDQKVITTIHSVFPKSLIHKPVELEKYIDIMNGCRVIITPDTLAMHISISLEKPVLAYFTVTSADEIEIYSGKKIIANHPDYCTYSKSRKKRPNIADSLDVFEISNQALKLVK